MITVRIAPKVSIIFLVLVFMVSYFTLTSSYLTVFGRQLSYADVLLVLAFLVLSPLFFKRTESTLSADRSVKLLYFIVIYAFFTTLWASHTAGYWFTFYQIALTFLTISIPYLVSKITNDKHIDYHKLISNFATLLSFIFLVYYFRMEDIGGRLSGSLGGAAIISVIIIPSLAVHFHNVLHRKRFLLSLVCLFISLHAVFYTQSRAGLVMLVLFIVITFLRKPSPKRIIAMVLLSVVFFLVFAEDISTERYEDVFEDEARNTALDSAINWWLYSPVSFIFGNGYGSLWQWAAYQSDELFGWYEQWTSTVHGPIMYHSHSVFNQLIGELGIIGLIPFLIFLYVLIKETWISWRNKNDLKTNILIALICTLPTFHTDLMIFRNWEVSLVWLFFLFTALRYIPKQADEINRKKGKRKRLTW